jgi:hypothetical protein
MEKVVIGDATVTAIYALCQGADDTPRYVGKTIQYLRQRHKAHIREALRGGKRPVSRWIRKQIGRNEILTIKLLEYVSGESWPDREKYWIEHVRTSFGNCLNLTSGGEGLAGHVFSKAHKEKISKALTKGKTHHCTQCGGPFHRKPNEAKSKNLFCSKSCYQSWQIGKKKNNKRGLMGNAGRAAALKKRRAGRG